ncbi:hypothetical protein MMC06_002751 [Schaereria dolodes]|nr:hypothetical protein [Schaereria dolodes]
MGSSYFYLEFLFAYLTLLKAYGYMNPAIFAPEYTLVPDAAYPTQLEEISAGYSYVCSLINDDASKICVAGDSAGATLVLSLLLRIAQSPDSGALRPGYATLISPWVTIVSDGNRDTLSDYLNASSLSLYGSQYASSKANLNSPLVSPGVCKDTTWWAKASPAGGFLFVYGSEEVLAPETRRFIKLLRKSGCAVSAREEPAGIHAWPVVTLFLSDTQEARVKGIKEIVKMVRQHVI